MAESACLGEPARPVKQLLCCARRQGHLQVRTLREQQLSALAARVTSLSSSIDLELLQWKLPAPSTAECALPAACWVLSRILCAPVH